MLTSWARPGARNPDPAIRGFTENRARRAPRATQVFRGGDVTRLLLREAGALQELHSATPA